MEDVIKKLKFKDTAIVINAPKALETEFERLGVRTSFDNNLKSANTLIFTNNKQEFLDFLKGPMQNIEADSVLWFAYPKGTSKIKTDINRDILNETAQGFGLRGVSIISVDATWSALRLRPIDKTGK